MRHQKVTNKEFKNTVLSKVEEVDANFLRPGISKVVRSNFSDGHLSKVDPYRHGYNHAKPCKFYIKYSPRQRAVLTSLYIWQLFLKGLKSEEQSTLFDIEKIGLEQEGPQQKEALWKR